MTLYEVVILIESNLPEREVDSILSKYKGMVKNHKGEVIEEENWGNRELAYPIQKRSRARYLFFCFKVVSAAMEEMSLDMRTNEKVLRYLVVKVDKAPDGPTPIMQRSENAR